jgi:hypothetical protein
MKQNKNTKNKFMQRPKENGYEFVTRIMKGATNKGERLSARQVQRLVDQRGSGKMNTAQVQSHLRYAAERTGLIIKHKDKIVCPIRKRRVDTYSYNYTGIPNALVDTFIPPHTKHKPIDENMFNKMQEAYEKVTDMDKSFVDFGKSIFNHDKKDQRDALKSTVQHHFTAEQLIESLGVLNPDLHDAVLITIAKAMGKTIIGTDPIPYMSWDYSNGNLVVKE